MRLASGRCTSKYYFSKAAGSARFLYMTINLYIHATACSLTMVSTS